MDKLKLYRQMNLRSSKADVLHCSFSQLRHITCWAVVIHLRDILGAE